VKLGSAGSAAATFKQLLNEKKYAEAFPIGKDILKDEPENQRVILDLTNAGYAANNASLDADTVAFAKKSIQLIESGKAPDKWAPFESKDDALGWLRHTRLPYTVGLIGILIGLGHSVLAMSGEETLAQVYREV